MGLIMQEGRIRAACLAVALAASGWALAQEKFIINGRLKVEGAGLDGCRMVVYKEGQKNRTVSTDLNRFSLELELNRNYVLSFEKDGFVTKKLSFDTKVPGRTMQAGFTPFDFVVSLFKQYDGVNTVVFNQPVGMIRYSEALGDFDYDTDYTKSIQSALEAAQAEVERKQKEEGRIQAEEARRKAQEAKAQAKAEARAAKEAAVQDKSRAKQEAVEAQAPLPPPLAPVPPIKEEVAVAPVPPVPKPVRKEPVRRPAVAAVVPRPSEGADMRRMQGPYAGQEPSRVQPAAAHVAEEPRPKFEPTPAGVVRHQDVIVQPNEVVTIIRLEQGEVITEYRRVSRKYSGVFYFKDGRSCSRLTYEQEALADN